MRTLRAWSSAKMPVATKQNNHEQLQKCLHDVDTNRRNRDALGICEERKRQRCLIREGMGRWSLLSSLSIAKDVIFVPVLDPEDCR